MWRLQGRDHRLDPAGGRELWWLRETFDAPGFVDTSLPRLPLFMSCYASVSPPRMSTQVIGFRALFLSKFTFRGSRWT